MHLSFAFAMAWPLKVTSATNAKAIGAALFRIRDEFFVADIFKVFLQATALFKYRCRVA